MAAIQTVLTGAGLAVREDTAELYSFEGARILLDCGDEYPDPVVGMGFVYWNLAVQLLVGAEGAVPKLAPETARAAAHVALYADRTLGGVVLDLVVGAVSRGIDEENPALGITRVTYNLKYRSMEGTA
jgi:hypothetical protein